LVSKKKGKKRKAKPASARFRSMANKRREKEGWAWGGNRGVRKALGSRYHADVNGKRDM